MRLTDLQKLQKLIFLLYPLHSATSVACLTAVGSTPLQKKTKKKINQQQQNRAHPVSHTSSFMLILCHWSQFYYEQCKAGNL